MESADPAVIRANNLKALPGEVMEAIALVNEVGATRRDGIPELLPGLNFVVGLAGETKETFELNRIFLDRVLSSGLLVRRVNIRQLMPFEGTRAFSDNLLGAHDREFRAFKEYARKNFDVPMLKSVFPVGTVLKEVIIEREGDVSFGRQMGSYPILVGIPLRLEPRSRIDAVVVDHGPRSVTALPVPVEINLLPASALSWIPGVGKKKAGKLVIKRPFSGLKEFSQVAGATPIDGLLSFSHLL
jgi:radical SAM superfamily enzyme with C-terminal helix-hairpin-helix motif